MRGAVLADVPTTLNSATVVPMRSMLQSTAPEVPMSLVTTPVSRLATCARCAGTRVTAISMTLTDGSSVDFASCHSCESKSWRQGDVELDIATVLGKAKKHKP